jgi:SAM-dependent methyltransferase
MGQPERNDWCLTSNVMSGRRLLVPRYRTLMPGTSFDRVAGIYDETRGGQRRGNNFADDISPWIRGSRVAELGIGTGVIAVGLRRHGFDAIGFDLSLSMMHAAVERVGQRVAAADVDHLPLPDNCIDTTILVWVLQLVADPTHTLREAARVTRPDGRVITVLSVADDHPSDEIASITTGLRQLRRITRGRDPILEDAPPSLRILHDGFTSWNEFEDSAAKQAGMIERREYSSLFDVDASTWTKVVEPVLAELRSLPEPDRARTRCNRHPLIVWEAT